MGKEPANSDFGLKPLTLALLLAAVEIGALFFCPYALAIGQESPHCDECEVARSGLDALMNGNLDSAIKIFQQIEARDPESPLGFLLEADAVWWKIYLTTANLVDPDVFADVYSTNSPYDSQFKDLVDEVIRKAEVKIHAGQDVTQNELYEGLGYALRARFFGLKDKDLAVARAAKKMRILLLAAVESDPRLMDAYAGLGLYNYFVDTLPEIVKMLKFLIALPGGSREVGLQQLQKAAEKGNLVRAEAKFYLAKNFSRSNEKEYQKSLELFHELSEEYPGNLLWNLLIGSLEIRLGRDQEGEGKYREVLTKSMEDKSEIGLALHHAAQEALRRLHPDQKIE